MSKYIQIEFQQITSDQSDVLLAQLSSIGFEGFQEEENSLKAFIPLVAFDETLLKEIDLNWKYGKDSYYYSRNSLKGETYSKKEYLEKLKNAGFGNHIVAINVLDKKTDWI